MSDKTFCLFQIFQLDQDGLHELNIQAYWQRKGSTYWVRYIHVEILGFTNSAIGEWADALYTACFHTYVYISEDREPDNHGKSQWKKKESENKILTG